MTSRVHCTPAELKVVQDNMNSLRTELMRHAMNGCALAGFADKEAHYLAALMSLIGAAQRVALTHRGLYGVFTALCADMANSTAHGTVTRGVAEMGPEIHGGGLAN
jgi:hypothetical protein